MGSVSRLSSFVFRRTRSRHVAPPLGGALVSRRRRVAATAALIVGATAGFGGAAVAQPAVDEVVAATKRAVAAWTKKDAATTVRELEAALAAARAQAPLQLRAVAVAQDKHRGLGVYAPVETGVVDGRALNLYVEVANYGTVEATPTERRARFDVVGAFSYEDTTESGAKEWVELGEKKLGTHDLVTRSDVGVTSFGLDVGLGTSAPAGAYRIVLKVHDTVANKRAERAVAFTLR